MNEKPRKHGRNEIPLRGERRLRFDRTLLMGILNLTADSFYPDSRLRDAQAALDAAERMAGEGADILDIGAESTRPGSLGVSEAAEIETLVPAVAAIRRRLPHMPISVDTRKAGVARRCLEAGADIVNDVSGLELPQEAAATARLIAETGAPYVLMHTQGTPEVMQTDPSYDDFRAEVSQFFQDKIAFLEAHGVRRERIILDPGIGFGKRPADNLDILAHLADWRRFGSPLLIAASRKRFIGHVLGLDDPADRLEGTVAVTALCASEGVEIVRVHDVAPNRRAADLMDAVRNRRDA